MKKLLVALALLTVSTVGYTKEVVAAGDFIYIIDGSKVYRCGVHRCVMIASDYTKTKK